MPVNLTSPDSSLQLQLHMLAPGASHSTPVARVEVAREKLDALRTQPTLIEGLTLQGPNAKGMPLMMARYITKSLAARARTHIEALLKHKGAVKWEALRTQASLIEELELQGPNTKGKVQ